jgi:hypothetical protein
MDTTGILTQAGITREQFEALGISGDALWAIRCDYESIEPQLSSFALSIASLLQKAPGVHSIKTECRDSTALLAGIIRRKHQGSAQEFSAHTYLSLCTDAAVIRALYVFEPDVRALHEYIVSTWNLQTAPCAMLSPGDPFHLRTFAEQAGCTIQENAEGSTGIIYRVESNLFKRPLIATIAVANIFDNLWSAIEGSIIETGRAGDSGLAAGAWMAKRAISMGKDLSAFLYSSGKCAAAGTIEKSVPVDDMPTIRSRPSPARAAMHAPKPDIEVPVEAFGGMDGELSSADLAATVAISPAELLKPPKFKGKSAG